MGLIDDKATYLTIQVSEIDCHIAPPLTLDSLPSATLSTRPDLILMWSIITSLQRTLATCSGWCVIVHMIQKEMKLTQHRHIDFNHTSHSFRMTGLLPNL
jgi:hypothetical protein